LQGIKYQLVSFLKEILPNTRESLKVLRQKYERILVRFARAAKPHTPLLVSGKKRASTDYGRGSVLANIRVV
jgi:hypothetical protein